MAAGGVHGPGADRQQSEAESIRSLGFISFDERLYQTVAVTSCVHLIVSRLPTGTFLSPLGGNLAGLKGCLDETLVNTKAKLTPLPKRQ